MIFIIEKPNKAAVFLKTSKDVSSNTLSGHQILINRAVSARLQ
jgi:hypothetical protein